MSERRVVQARRPTRYGGGICTVLVVRVDGRVELLPHAVDGWAVELDEQTATELRDALSQLLTP